MIQKTTSIASILLVSICACLADITLKTPKNGSKVSQQVQEIADFYAKTSQERMALMRDENFRKDIAKIAKFPKPINFTWEGTSGKDYVLEVSENPKFKKAIKIHTDKNNVRVRNLKMAQKYFWRVSSNGEKSPVFSFETDDVAPRQFNIAGAWNIRDLGGRKGLNGKRIRQNLIIRGGGLNLNSEDGVTKGKTSIKPDGIKFMLRTLKIKTDLDLRSKKEVADMNASPLGNSVKWISIPSEAYAGTFSEKGKDAFVKAFRLFCDKKNYPIYMHCIGGADRTGSLAFILNAILGVSADELEKDWQATIFTDRNMDFVAEPRYVKLVEGFDEFGTKDESYTVKVERYLKSGGITDKEIAKFRKIMLKK